MYKLVLYTRYFSDEPKKEEKETKKETTEAKDENKSASTEKRFVPKTLLYLSYLLS